MTRLAASDASRPELLEDRGARGWFARGFDAPVELGSSPRDWLEVLFELEPVEWLRRVPGRETFAWPGHPDWIVKRTIGGEVRDYWYELLRGGTRSPARREAENLGGLAAAGVRVPRALAWFEEPAAARHPRLLGRGGRSALVMERVEHGETLRQRLGGSSPGDAARLERELLEQVTRLHQGGWCHRDLYLQHFVLGRGANRSELVLLDAGRARREERLGRRWLEKDLAALWHSAPAGVSRARRLRFLHAWLAARGEDRGAARGWTRAVLARARRLAAHAPRKIDPRTATSEPARFAARP